MSKTVYNLIATDAAFVNPVAAKIDEVDSFVSGMDVSNPPAAWSWTAQDISDVQNAITSYLAKLAEFKDFTNRQSGISGGENDLRRILSIAGNSSSIGTIFSSDEDFNKPMEFITSLTDSEDVLQTHLDYFETLDNDLQLAGSTPRTAADVVSQIETFDAALQQFMDDDAATLTSAEQFLKETSLSQTINPFANDVAVKEVLFTVATDQLKAAIEDDEGPVTASPQQQSQPQTSSPDTFTITAQNIFVGDKGGYYQSSKLEQVLQEIGAAVIPYFGNINDRVTDVEENLDVNATAISTLETRIIDAEDSISAISTSVTELSSDVSDLYDAGTTNLLFDEVFDAVSEESATSGPWTKGPVEIQLADVGLTDLDIISARAKVRTDGGGVQVYLRVEFRNGAAIIGFSEASYYSGTDYVEQILENLSIPAGTDNIRVGVGNDGGAGTSFAKNLSMNQGPIAIPFDRPSASSNAFQLLETRVTNSEGNITSNAQAITSIQAEIDDPNTGLDASATAIDTLEVTVGDHEDGVFANATNISELETSIGDNTTSISTVQSSVNGLEGQWAVKIKTNAGGKEYMAGFGLSSTTTDADDPENFSEFRIIADRFVVYDEDDIDSDDPQPLFSVGNDSEGNPANNFTFGAQLFEDEYSGSTYSLWDGTDEDTWKSVADMDVYIRQPNNIVSIEFNMGVSMKQVSTRTTSAGPGGPTCRMRLLRDGTEIWVSDDVVASAMETITFNFATRSDQPATIGLHNYEIQAKWNTTTYSAGTVDVNNTPTPFYSTSHRAAFSGSPWCFVKGTGTFWTSFINNDWQIRVPGINSNWYHIWNPRAQMQYDNNVDNYPDDMTLIMGLNTNTFITMPAANIDSTGSVDDQWPNSVNVSGQSYEMRNPYQEVIADVSSWWIRAIEYASPNIR